MKVLYYDCFSGISGDMNLGAMISLGVSGEYLIEELGKLSVTNEFSLSYKSVKRKGINGIHVKVNEDITNKHNHQKRKLSDLQEIIRKSSLEKNVKKIALKIFKKIAMAEATVHGVSIHDVHFHEVGAIDSIVDIVGAAICFDTLKVDAIICSPLELGGGLVECAHGIIPVPAPATVEILKGVPVKLGAVQYETTTPTGAAIIATMADNFSFKTSFSVLKTGYGVGSRDHEIPNMLRIMLAETKDISQEFITDMH